jgi:hypothetical protein
LYFVLLSLIFTSFHNEGPTPENRGFGDSLRLYPEKKGGWSLLPIAAGKQRKLVLPMNVILQDI